MLPVISKIFERLMQKQLCSFIEKHLSPVLCGYRNGYSPQLALIMSLEKWKAILDQQSYAGAMLMDFKGF